MVAKISVLIAVLIVAALVIGGVFAMRGRQSATASPSPSASAKPTASVSPAAGLQKTDEVIGTGAEAKLNDTITVKYTGTLPDGTVFDSTDKTGQPATFQLKEGSLIEGWIQGIPGMKVGGKRKLVIPPSLGYGSQAVGSIPPNSTLTFDIELIDVK